MHSDLKSFPIESYHCYKYIITFVDDFTSFAWIMPIHTKDAALTATKHFLSMVQMQFNAKVKGWMLDAEGEYKSQAFDKLLADNGINVFQSTPHVLQQNGCTE